MKRDFRKPLVLMSPKSLLRHPLAVSRLDELSRGAFQPVLDGPPVSADLDSKDTASAGNGRAVKRLILCSGKVYYDLWERRQELKAFATALLRVEQLYPFPADSLGKALDGYPGVKDLRWVQEEPANRGALRYMREQLLESFPDRAFTCVSRPASASPAVGSHRQHVAEQRELVDRALEAGPGSDGDTPGSARASAATGKTRADTSTECKPTTKRAAGESAKRGKA
jgi:2-oxoglutarate dehydrogenase E1 component